MSEHARKLIFIMGHSRSGSTILNILLGNLPGVAAVGELNNFYLSGVLNDEYCSCGVRVSECDFWSDIAGKTRQSLDNDVAGFSWYSRQLENWRNIWMPGREKRLALDRARYIEINGELLDRIYRAANVTTLVDASKDPMRYRYLREIAPPLDIRLLHIVRDPRAVCHSQAMSFKKSLEKGLQRDMPATSLLATIKSLYINAYLSEKMKRLADGNSLFVQYDEMARHPEAVLQSIGEFIGQDTTALIDTVRQAGELTQFHNVAGNRLRMQQKIVLKHDDAWMTKMPRYKQWIVSVLTLPLLLRYGFLGARRQ